MNQKNNQPLSKVRLTVIFRFYELGSLSRKENDEGILWLFIIIERLVFKSTYFSYLRVT